MYQVVSVNSLSLLTLAFLAGLEGDKTNEVCDAFLHKFFALLRNFSLFVENFFHDSANVCDGQVPHVFGILLIAALVFNFTLDNHILRLAVFHSQIG